jgi:lysozyme
MKTSSVGIALLKEFEGLRLQTYKDAVGVLTIGYGTTSMTGVGKITSGMTITREQAEEWLVVGLAKYEKTVSEALKVPTNQNQFDAMVSLCYNIGQGAFLKSSVLRHHNAGDVVQAAKSFALWNKAGGIALKGLTRRREAEAELYAAMPLVVAPAPTVAPETPSPKAVLEVNPGESDATVMTGIVMMVLVLAVIAVLVLLS